MSGEVDLSKAKMVTSEVYVVVCHNFHNAVGPVLDLLTATTVARKMTEQSKSGCIYQPVPLQIIGGSVAVVDPTPGKKTEEVQLPRGPAGYL